MTPAALLLALALAAQAQGTEPRKWSSSYKDSAASAAQDGRLLLVDFQAVWCYSCYYMEQKVLTKEPFAAAARDLALVKLDVDQPEGERLRQSYKVQFLPSYLLLRADGSELGRIAGEQTEKDFLAKLEELRGRGAEPTPARLRSELAAGSLDQAERSAGELLKLKPDSAGDPAFKILSARLELSKAAKNPDKKAAAPAVAAALEKLLNLERGCELAYDAMTAEDFIAELEPARRKTLWAIQRQRLQELSERKVFGPASERCADLRSPVEALVDTLEALGRKSEKERLLARMSAQLEAMQGPLGPGQDRNLDDNGRFFLELSGQNDKLDALYPKLAAAYPADYVYAYRYAKNLHSRKKDAEALPWIEKAQGLAYGANRATVSRVHAQILQALHRDADAAAFMEKN